MMRYDGADWRYHGSATLSLPHAAFRAVSLVPGEDYALAASDNALVVRVKTDGWDVDHGERWLTGLAMPSPDEGWAVGPGGPALRLDRNSWAAVDYPPEMRRLQDIDGLAPDDLWAVGTKGTILHYDGLGWTLAPQETSANLRRVRVVSPTDVWAVGDLWVEGSPDVRGEILHFDGQWWTLSFRHVGENMEIRDIDAAGAENVWAVGDGFLLHKQGDLWASVPVGANLYAIDMVSPVDGWAAGKEIILHYNGDVWERSVGSDLLGALTVERLQMNSDGTGWAVGWNGIVLHYDGDVWQFVRTPEGPLKAGSSPFVLLDLEVTTAGDQTTLRTVGAPETVLRWHGDPAAFPTITPTPTSTPYVPPRRPTGGLSINGEISHAKEPDRSASALTVQNCGMNIRAMVKKPETTGFSRGSSFTR